MANPPPVSSTPGILTREHLLQLYPNLDDSEVIKQVQELRKAGNHAHKSMDNHSAIKMYTEAISLIGTRKEFLHEAAILYSNRSAAYHNMMKYIDALTDALASLNCDPKWHRGYERKAKALKCLTQFADAYKSFLDGFFQSDDPDNKVKENFLFEAVCLLHLIEGTEIKKEYDLLKEVDKKWWGPLLVRLGNDGKWWAIGYLMIGPDLMNLKDQRYNEAETLVSGVAAGVSTNGVPLKTLFEFLKQLDTKTDARWLDRLILMLMESSVPDARLHSLREDEKDGDLHAVVRFSLMTGGTSTLNHILNKFRAETLREPGSDIMLDGNSDTVFHTMAKFRPHPEPSVLKRTAELMLGAGLNAAVKNKEGKLPVDCLDKKYKGEIFDLFRKASGKLTPTDIAQLKQEGNMKFEAHDCVGAGKSYSQAIQIFENSCRMPTGLNYHDISDLYASRAAVFLGQEKYQEALNDAKKSVFHDQQFYRGHICIGSALRGLQRFEESLQSLNNALIVALRQHDNIKVDIIMELTRTYQLLPRRKFPLEASLSYNTTSLIWFRAAYNFILHNEWNMAYVAYLQAAVSVDVKAHFPLDSKPLCNVEKAKKYPWLMHMLYYLVWYGSDYKMISCYPGDTYFHAVAYMTIKAGNIKNKMSLHLLKHIMDEFVIKNKDQNIVDSNGDTVLHIVAHEPCNDARFRRQIIMFLAENDVNPFIKNKDGKTVKDKTYNIHLRNVQTLISSIQELWKDSHKDLSEMTDYKQKQAHSQAKNKSKKGKGKEESPENRLQGQDQGTVAVPRNRFVQCDWCVNLLQGSEHDFSKGNQDGGYQKLIKVLEHKHQSNQQSITAEVINAIVGKLRETTPPEIPDCFTSMSETMYKLITMELIKLKKWRLLDAAVCKYQKKHGSDKLKSFASSIDIVDVIGDTNLRAEDMPQVVILMLDNGAALGKDGGIKAVQAAVGQGHFKVIVELLKRDANPSAVSLTDGDTPLHAALRIVLEKDKDSLTLFEALLCKFDSDPVKFACLDPSQVDANGDSLFHLLAKCTFSSAVLKVIETLCKRKLTSSVRNLDGKLPVDYITEEKDRRKQFLRMVATTDASKVKKISIDKMSFINEKTGDETIRNVRKAINPSTEREELKNRIKEKIKLLEDSKSSVFSLSTVKPSSPGATQKHHESKAILKCPTLSGLETEQTSAPTEQKVEETAESLCKKDEEQLNAWETKPEDTFDTVGMEAEEGRTEEEETEEITIDAKVFDGLPWEVECTENVWKKLRDKRVSSNMKKRIVESFRLLANGDWSPHLCKQLHGVPSGLQLYEAKVSKAGRVLWQLAIAFSPRCSRTAEQHLSGQEKRTPCPDSGGRIYSEIIRIWDIVPDHDRLYRSVQLAVQRIINSHNRGETCIIQKKLLPSSVTETPMEHKVPRLFAEAESDLEHLQEEEHKLLQKYFPPASPKETEYHILKFYTFNSALISHILQNIDIKVDFPFRVTDLEHDIIMLSSTSPILLLGRSGTGKTTCCLYRLWTLFLNYWEKAKDPFLPRIVEHKVEEKGGNEEEKEVEEKEIKEHDGEDGVKRVLDDKDMKPGPGAVCGEMPQDENSEDNDQQQYIHLRQIFVTKNAVLCKEMQKNFNNLCHACDSVRDHMKQEEEKLPNMLQEVDCHSYPLFLTSRQLLLMLDASVGTPYFFDRKTDGSLKACIQGWSDDDDDPLSILSLLEEDSDIEGDEEGYNYSDSEREEEEDQKEEALGTSQTKLDPKREVTYEVFVQEVWPQMKNKDSYHPTLVWTEFISFIKGSYKALSQPKGYVSKKTYHKIGKKRAPHFHGERDKIYELFKQYNNIMRQNKLFDETDLIHNVYTRIQNLKGEQLFDIHQIFVDEIQDFTQAEQYLLIQICKNPNQMFLTGDTAQSIMRGISFRFEDLKSLFYHAKKATQAKWKKEAVQVPKQVYQLVQNYRSHEGILSLASSILDLLVEFFPESFDPLKKDQGLFSDGPHPILIESSSFSDLAMLLRGNHRKTSAIEFGAHQAVLVVNEAAREFIPEELKLGLVLTIYEAKGLEFDDVLLYNFFKDSQADKEWRVVTEYLEELLSNQKDSQQGASYIASKSLVEIDESVLQQEGRSRPLHFEPNLHKVLNSELKHLYTALTRARVNVWIFDENPKKRAPMFQYFKARKLVKSLGKLDESNLTDVMFAEKSSQEDWIHRGKDFQNNALYEVAAKCYGIAGETAKQKVALAHHGALVASRLKDNPHAMCHEFLKVAELYLECDRPDKAAICLKNAREPELAAQLLEKLGKFEEAAGLYRRMKRPLDSSRCFEFMWNFNRAVEVLYENEYYDEVIDTQHRYKLKRKEYESRGEPIPQYLLTNEPQEKFSEERVSYKAADKHHRTNNPKKMMDALDRLPRWEDRVDFLKKNNYVDDAVEILEKHGKVEEATNLLLIHGKIKEAETVARKTLDESTLAQTLLVCSRVLMSQQQERCSSTEELQKMVKETKEIFVRCKNADGSAEASLQLADLAVSKSDIAQSEIYFRQAWNLFCDSKPYSNLPGSLECVEWFVTHTPITKDNFKYLVQAFDHLFKVVQILCCQKSSVDEELSNYDRFYGLIDSKKDSVICYPKQIPRCKSMISDMLSSQQKMVEIEINKNKANEKLALYLLNRAKHWLKVAIEGILRIRNQFQQCHYYQIGHSCPHMEKQEERCPKLHRAHTRETFNALIGTDRLFIELQRNIEFGARTLIETNLSSLDEHIKYFLSYQVTTSLGDNISKFTSCQMILDDLPPRSQCVHVFFKRYPSEFLRPMNAPLRQYIQAFVEEEWKKATDGDKKFDTAAARSANTFLMIEFCCHLIPINFNFGKRLADFENALSQEQYSWNSHRKWNSFALMKDFKDRDVNKEGGRMLIVQSLAHRFSDSYSHLTKADPFEALVKFTKFIALIQTKEQKVLPEPKFLVMWMEFYTILAFFLIAKVHKEIQGNSSELQDAFFFVPASYLHLMDFIEATFPKSTTFIQKAVHLTQRKYDEKFIQDRLHYFVKLLCDKAESLMLVSAHFSADHDSTISCAEEALVLTMTLVSNVGTFVSKESETALMQTLSRLKVPDKCPNRVMLALKAVQNAQGVRDVGVALRELLNKREDEHFICCKWIPISRQKGQRVFIHTYKLTSVDPLPVNFLGQNTLAAMHHDSGLVQQLTESLGDQEEEMSMSMEEKMMLDRDIAQEQEEIILKERETKLEDLHARDKQDEQMNILETTELTDVYCVPCNISYEELIKQRCHFSDVEVKSVSYVEMEQQLTPDMANVSKALKMNAISGRNDMTENEEISGTVNLTQSLASRLPDTTQFQWDATNSSEQEGNRKDNAISDGKCGPLRDYSVDASESRTKLTYPADENATDYTRSFSYDPSAEIGDTAQPTEEEIKEMRKMELRLIKEEHVKSPEHIQKENEFDSFQKLCQTVEAQVKKMQDVIQQYELNNPDMRNAAYSHKLIYINRIENCMESIINEKNKIRKERSWHKTGDLETMLTEMRQACDMVLHNVEDEYNKFKQEYESRGEPIPQYLLTNEPQEKFSEERVSYKAADKHHRTNNPKKMMDALDRLPRWEDRVDFLKKNNYVDDAVEILEKHGKVEEATNLLLIHGKIKEAETVARKTLDESTLAQTLLVCSRVLMSQQQERCSSTEELQKMVKETKEIFVRCKNADGSAEASLQLADLAVSKSDIAQSEIYFRQAWNLFCDSKPYSNLPGSLECVEWFVTHTPITKDNFKYLVQAFDHLFKVVQILCCQKSSVDEELSNYDRFYGLIDSKKDSVICYPKQIPRCKSMISDMLSSQQKMVEIEINKNKANEKLALYLLNRAKHWLKVAIEGILRIRNQFQQCHYYQIGHSCPHMEKQEERCPKLHRAHTRETFNALIGTDRLFIELQRNIEFGARTLIETNLSSLDEHIKYFLSYQVTTSLGDNISKFTSCQMILDDLPPRSQCVHVFFKRYPSEFLRPMNAPLRQYIQAFVEEEWKKATDGDKKFDTAAARSANTFLMIEFCCHLIPINFNFGKRLADFENALSQEQYSWNSHRKWNSFALMKDFKDRDVNKEGGRMLIVQSLAHRFSDSYSHLTKADPFEALVKFTKFIALIQTKEQKVLPEPKFLVMWMEFYTILAFFLIAKVHKEIQGNSSELQDAFFFVPASYLHLMDFIEATFPKSTTFIQKAVHLTQRKYDEKFIQDRLHYFVKLLCDKAESLMLVSAHFSADHDSTISCAEEALVLTMTLVSNVGTFVSKESETALMQTLSRLKVPDKCPNRVMLALKAVQNAQGVRDVGVALRELLNKREDEHFICCKWIPISRQKGQRVFIHTYKLTSVDPLPVNFLGQNTLAAMHHDSGLVQQLTESLGDQEEEMSMSMEEKMMLDRDIAQEQEEIILKERETKLEDLHARDKQDEQMNILETTELTDVYCVPCNISYEELIKQRCHFSDVEVKSVSYVEMEQQLTPDMANVSKALKMNAISGRNDMTENEEISGTVNLTQSLASRLPDTTQFQWDATNSSEQEGNRKDNAISDGKCGPLRDYSVDASESRTKLTYPADENATDYTRSFSYDPSAEIGDTAQPTEEEIKEMRKMELRLIKEEHVKSPEHIQKENEFDSFQKLCQTVEAQVKKMQDVIQQYELNNPDMRNAAYSHKLIYINRIENCMESIINEKNKIRKERSWHKTGDLETMLTEMRQACDMVLHNVEDEYNKFKQEEKERQEPRAMRRMISETDNVEIEEVVKQPQNYNSKRKNKKPRRGHKR